MLKFEHPDYLWLLAAMPLLFGWFVFVAMRRKRSLAQIVSASLWIELAPEVSVGKHLFKHTLVVLAVIFLILAIANPLVGTRIEEVKREGIDLFVALDVSMSMKAEDIKPSRLEKAKRDISSLLKKLAGDRVGLIVFAGDAFVQFPLTSDYSAADLFINSVDVDAVPTPGTVIASAIDMALNSFPKDAPTQKAIIVASDGENTEGDVLAAVEEAKKQNVRVYTVGMGSPEGGPIPVYDGETRVDYKRDRSGSIVLSKIDEPMMQQIAEATGGSYRRATSGGNEIDEIYKELGSLQKTEFGAKQISGYESRYQWPLGIALFLLLLEVLVSERRVRAFDAFRRFVPAAGLLLVLMMSGIAQAQTERGHIKKGNSSFEKGDFTDAEASYKKALVENPKSREAQFNLGDAQFKQKRYDEAIREFQNSAVATKEAHDRSAALYNIGNSLFEANKYAESIEAYKKSLALNPTDEDTRYNLMLAKDRLKQQQQDQKQNKQNKDDKQKQDQQKQDQQKQDQQKQDQQQQQQSQQDKEKKQEQQQSEVQKKNQLPKQEAERILEALRNNEKDIQKRLMKRPASKIKVEKDW